MRTSRVLVRLPHSHVGLMLLSAVLGAGAAIPVAAYTWLWRYHPDFFSIISYRIWIINSIQAFLALIPYAAFLYWLTRECQHVRWVMRGGALYALTLCVLSKLGTDLYVPWQAFNDPVEYLVLPFLATTFGAGSALFMWLIQRAFLSRIVEQDGTLCSQCAYPAGQSRSDRCPECGATSGPVEPSRSDRMIALASRRRGLLALTLIIVVVAGNVLVIRARRDHRTLGDSFGEHWSTPSWSFNPIDMGASVTTATRRTVTNGPPSMVLVVELQRQPTWLPHRMYIRVGGSAVLLTEQPIPTGDPLIFMIVPREKVRSVLRDGPPEHVIVQLVKAARDAQWERDDSSIGTAWPPATHRIEVPWDTAAE